MDKLTRYRDLVQRLMGEFVALVNRQSTVGTETICVFDQERDHYLVLAVGWNNRHRVRGCPLFVRIRDGQFWIEEDLTEEGIASSLVRAGVPRTDIVLAFQAPDMRPLSEFAVA